MTVQVRIHARASGASLRGLPSQEATYPDRDMLVAAMAVALVNAAGSRAKRSGRFEATDDIQTTGSATLDAAMRARSAEDAREAIAGSGLPAIGIQERT